MSDESIHIFSSEKGPYSLFFRGHQKRNSAKCRLCKRCWANIVGYVLTHVMQQTFKVTKERKLTTKKIFWSGARKYWNDSWWNGNSRLNRALKKTDYAMTLGNLRRWFMASLSTRMPRFPGGRGEHSSKEVVDVTVPQLGLSLSFVLAQSDQTADRHSCSSWLLFWILDVKMPLTNLMLKITEKIYSQLTAREIESGS